MLIEMRGHGHYRLLGQTIDDAAGEAFDKVARFLGLGYPGGPAIDQEADRGDPTAIAFPRAMLNEGLDFSFSGLKTSVVNYVRKNPDVSAADVAASFQAAVVDVLVAKARRAAASVGARGLAIGGGVAAMSPTVTVRPPPVATSPRTKRVPAVAGSGVRVAPSEPGADRVALASTPRTSSVHVRADGTTSTAPGSARSPGCRWPRPT